MKNVLVIIAFVVFTISCTKQHPPEAHVEIYTCPMHPQIQQDKPGRCPICHMKLVKMSGAEDDGSLRLNETQIELADITTARATAGNIQTTTILNGRIVIDQDRSEAVSVRTNGRIERLYVKEEGQHVRKGQLLYEIYSEELMVLQKEYLASIQQRSDEGNSGVYDSFVQAAEKKLLLFGMMPSQIKKIGESKQVLPRTTVFSNASGVVSRIDVQEGQYVKEGDPLFQIENLDKVWVEADLYAAETHALYKGDAVKARITGFENQPVDANVIFISPEFRDDTQVLSVRLLLDNADHRFLPGMQAQIFSPKIEHKVIFVSRDAIIHDGEQNYAWVRNKNGSFSPRRILTGVENENMIEVRYGLEENDDVVVTGAYLLYSERILKRGHAMEDAMR